MSLRVLRILFLLGALFVFYLAFSEYEAGNGFMAQYAAEMPLFSQAQQEVAELSALPSKQLLPADEALEEFLGRMLDDTELMGSSVRLDLGQTGIAWQPINHGVQSTVLGLTTSSLKQSALGYFSILWQLLGRQPLRVRSARISAGEDTVTFNVEVELIALEGGGTGG